MFTSLNRHWACQTIVSLLSSWLSLMKVARVVGMESSENWYFFQCCISNQHIINICISVVPESTYFPTLFTLHFVYSRWLICGAKHFYVIQLVLLCPHLRMITLISAVHLICKYLSYQFRRLTANYWQNDGNVWMFSDRMGEM